LLEVSELSKDLKALATKERQIGASKYFKTGPGEYGEGDTLIGVTVPDTRKIAKQYKDIHLEQLDGLAHSKIHEERLCALMILINQHKKTSDIKNQKQIANFYLKNRKYINNWDLVDLSAYKILGPTIEQDPVLKTWAKAFPNALLPKSAISKQLMEHVRYPEDLFRVQREILSSYHVRSAEAFYGGQDFWRIPRDPSTFGANAGAQPPYYLTIQMPGTKAPVFSLTTPFVPRGGRENLSAFAVVNSDAGPDYGKMSVLQLPRNTNIAGPSQVASNFEAKPEVANSLSLLRRGGSDVVLGNLLTLPVGGGLLYVQPVYVQATANTSAYPLLQKVLVSFGDQIG
jgi:uncharacterized membrane protein (UPF0182 family)